MKILEPKFDSHFFSQILMKIGYRVTLKRRTQELHLISKVA